MAAPEERQTLARGASRGTTAGPPNPFNQPRQGRKNFAHGASHGKRPAQYSPNPRSLLREGGNGKALEEGVICSERVYNQVFDGSAENSGDYPE